MIFLGRFSFLVWRILRGSWRQVEDLAKILNSPVVFSEPGGWIKDGGGHSSNVDSGLVRILGTFFTRITLTITGLRIGVELWVLSWT